MGKRPNYRGDEAHARRARQQGYVARSVFKLEELDKRFQLLRKGQVVLDVGAAPGSWSQYAQKRVGPTGLVLSVDLKEITAPLSGVVVQQDARDVREEQLAEWTGGRAPPLDLILSDMAPNTTGVPYSDHVNSVELCDIALDLAVRWLRPGGALVCKVFQGPDEAELRGRVKARFGKVKASKPKTTRSNSVEIFFVAQGFR